MGHDVGEVVAAARLQVDVADRIGERLGGGDVDASVLEPARRCFDPRGKQQGGRLVPSRHRRSRRVKRGEQALRATAVTEDDPGPTEADGDRDAERRVVRGGPGQGGVDVRSLRACDGEVLGLGGAADAVGVRPGGARIPAGIRGEGTFVSSRLGHRVAGVGADALEESIAARARLRLVDDEQRAAREAAEDVKRGRRRNVERPEHALDRGKRCAAGERREGPQASLVVGKEQVIAPADGRLEQRGGAPAGGWSGRSRH